MSALHVNLAKLFLSENDNHNDDGRAGLSRIEIYAYGLVQGKQGGLIVAKSDVGGCAVFEESHERDLNCFSGSIQDIAQLYYANRALDGRPRLDGTTKEYIAAPSREEEQRDNQNGQEEALHKAPSG